MSSAAMPCKLEVPDDGRLGPKMGYNATLYGWRQFLLARAPLLDSKAESNTRG